jgi:hypothetical protein
MIEKKRIEEAARNVRQYTADGLLKTRDNESKKLASFFLDQAERQRGREAERQRQRQRGVFDTLWRMFNTSASRSLSAGSWPTVGTFDRVWLHSRIVRILRLQGW